MDKISKYPIQHLIVINCEKKSGNRSLNFQKLTKLKKFESTHTVLSEGDFQTLAPLPNLESFIHMASKISSKELIHFKHSTSLRELDLLSSTELDDTSLSHLTKLSLYSLCLQGCKKITAQGLVHVGKITTLKNLNLAFCTCLINGGARNLSGLSMLVELNLNWCSNLTDDELAQLPSSLTKLELKECSNLTDQGVANLVERCLNLEYLDISFCRGISMNAWHMLSILPLK